MDAGGGANAPGAVAPAEAGLGGRIPYGGSAGRGGRGRQRDAAPRSDRERFVGASPDIGVFDTDTTGDGVDLFNRTVKSIQIKVGSTNMKYMTEISQSLVDLVLLMPAKVPNPAESASAVAIQIWKEARKDQVERHQVYSDFKSSLYSLVLGQCTRSLEDKIEASPDFAVAQHDGIRLLVLIRTLMSRFDSSNTSVTLGCLQLLCSFTSLQIARGESLSRFHDKFVAQAEVLVDLEIDIVPYKTLVEVVVATGGYPNDVPDAGHIKAAYQKTLAMCFILGTASRYQGYVTELKNAMLEGRDNYPVTLAAAYHILRERSQDQVPASAAHGVAFVTNGEAAPTPGDNGVVHAQITCHSCQLLGHYSNHCPTAAPVRAEGKIGIVLSQTGGSVIPRTWVLLDNQANVDMFHNASLLKDIQTVDHWMSIHCNAGVTWTNQQGLLPGYGLVWYCPTAIANILSFANVSSRCWVTYDNRTEWKSNDKFVVTKEDGSVQVFGKSDNGLYFYDMAVTEHSAVLVNMVEENKTRYTDAEVTRASNARVLQTSIGRPSTRRFIDIVNNNELRNCPVTKRDIMAAEDIFGPDLGGIKGKTTRRAPRKVTTDVSYTTLPRQVHERYKMVTIGADIMHVNGIMFFVSISRHIKLGVIEAIPNKDMSTILKSMKSVAAIYHNGGFRVRHALMDGAFKSLEESLMGVLAIRLNTTSRDEHVGEIERYIRTVKERMRSTVSVLPFNRYPPRVVIELAKREVFWLNAFASRSGISKTLSPRTIVSGDTVSFDLHCKYDFGEYVQTHEEHGNDMASRTVGALALRPTGNKQGGFYFFSLTSGQVLNRNYATKLPMPNEVIERVHLLARRQKANMGGLVFGDRDRNIIDDEFVDEVNENDDENDEDYVPSDDDDDYDDDVFVGNGGGYVEYPSDNDDDDDDEIPENGPESDDDTGSDDDAESDHDGGGDEDNAVIEAVVADVDTGDEVDDEIVEDVDLGDEVDDEVEEDVDLGDEVDDEVEAASEEDDDDGDIAARMDVEYGPRTGRYNLRNRKKVSFGHLHANVADTGKTGVQPILGKTGVRKDSDVPSSDSQDPVATPQMSMARGLKLFGMDGELAVTKEMQQLHDRMVMKVTDAKEMTSEQRRDALAYLMFLKRKRCGKIKGRGCADGRKQRAWTDKADSSSPTIATAAMFLTVIVDAMEGRDVAVVDVPGAFMQADMDELVHVRFTGLMVDKLLEIDNKMYAPYIVYEGKVKCLYVELLKALYGTLRAARLFWDKLSNQLLEWGFVANPYDSCVVNKMINGKQCTIGWHVDDLKISHVDPLVVDTVIDMMDGKFGQEEPLSKSRGKVHDYLGIVFDFTVDGEVKVDMSDYIRTIFADMPEDMIGTAATPAAGHLFNVNENPVLLCTEKAELLHRMVMQLLYLSQRGRPDIQTAVSYLCRRTGAPDEDDYKKLTRVMRYLQGTPDLVLTLSCDGTDLVRWWVDASYGVHADMKSHTGITMSMGKGSVYSASGTQKIVGCSSTEAELIGVHDAMPMIIWSSNFLKAQGFKADSVLYQDNKSTILLANNGRASVGKRSRHINIRYFFVKDRIANGELRTEYCPTLEMWADFFTKPLQGGLFYKFRDLIMNIDPSSSHHSSRRSVLKNSVETPEARETFTGHAVVPGARRTYADAVRR